MEIIPTADKVTVAQLEALGFVYMNCYKSIDAIYEYEETDEVRVSLTIGKFTKGIRVQRKYANKMNTVEWSVMNNYTSLITLLLKINHTPALRVERERKIDSLENGEDKN